MGRRTYKATTAKPTPTRWSAHTDPWRHLGRFTATTIPTADVDIHNSTMYRGRREHRDVSLANGVRREFAF
jgi:hypothetical protein